MVSYGRHFIVDCVQGKEAVHNVQCAVQWLLLLVQHNTKKSHLVSKQLLICDNLSSAMSEMLFMILQES